jgi:hypothetical protein
VAEDIDVLVLRQKLAGTLEALGVDEGNSRKSILRVIHGCLRRRDFRVADGRLGCLDLVVVDDLLGCSDLRAVDWHLGCHDRSRRYVLSESVSLLCFYWEDVIYLLSWWL